MRIVWGITVLQQVSYFCANACKNLFLFFAKIHIQLAKFFVFILKYKSCMFLNTFTINSFPILILSNCQVTKLDIFFVLARKIQLTKFLWGKSHKKFVIHPRNVIVLVFAKGLLKGTVSRDFFGCSCRHQFVHLIKVLFLLSVDIP